MRKQLEIDLSEFEGLPLIHVDATSILFDGASLELNCPWRMRDEIIYCCPQVLEAPETQEETAILIQNDLIGKTIKSIKAYVHPCDLEIVFEGGTVLEVFPNHPFFESWQLRKEGGKQMVGMPGGELTYFD